MKLTQYMVPIVSVIVFALAYFFLEPTTTGLVVLNPEGTQLVDADVTLSTKKGEVIPPNAIVEVWIDDKKSEMTIKDFITRTENDYEIAYGELPEFGFYGEGYTGDYDYRLTLGDFPINREIGVGEHTFKTRIVYRSFILYEKENSIIISEQ